MILLLFQEKGLSGKVENLHKTKGCAGLHGTVLKYRVVFIAHHIRCCLAQH